MGVIEKIKSLGSVEKRRTDESFNLSNEDIYLFREGSHFRLYEKFGACPARRRDVLGTYFTVWAPNARAVSVIGDFNGWNRRKNPMYQYCDTGIWQGFVPNIGQGTLYKYSIVPRWSDKIEEKADPFAFHAEVPPKSASVVWELDYNWADQDWMRTRGERQGLKSPMSIYELHLGSWRRKWDQHGAYLSYRELAVELAAYVKKVGFTHVELMPVMEHPFTGSWGYQVTGYFAPTSRFGTPQDFMYFIDHLHQNGIGVILDWVPSHFPTDGHGLGRFDGTAIFEHPDSRKGFHPDWSSFIFDYGRPEVKSFLISNALFWLDKYHADGLRVDAVASMLYLDYSRRDGEWIPNEFGGRENLDAIHFLRELNRNVYKYYPDVQTAAEESTAWPMVSRPSYMGGLGFGFKWDMGWMHDMLEYMSKDPIYRKYHQNNLTFRLVYAFHENFILSLSHDEVVHGKGSLIGKMPGDKWQKLANLRALYGYMFAQPGKKLLFMGDEFGQELEWNHDWELSWGLLSDPGHAGLLKWVTDLHAFYKREPALYERDFNPEGFEWVDFSDWTQSIISFIRKGDNPTDIVLAVLNFAAIPRFSYRVGCPFGGIWTEELNSDQEIYFGSGVANKHEIEAARLSWHYKSYSMKVNLPPLGALFLKYQGESREA